jgi:hypothetical protein
LGCYNVHLGLEPDDPCNNDEKEGGWKLSSPDEHRSRRESEGSDAGKRMIGGRWRRR